jgi:hypothetical protein
MGYDEGSDRSRLVTLLLGGFLGVFGVHRFYVGKAGTALLMLGTLGGFGVWWAADVILIAAGSFRDGEGRRVKYWTEDDAHYHRGGVGEPMRQLPTEVMEELDTLRAEVADLAERVDFTERLLTQRRHAGQLDSG